jgi:uncharacterized membrane protein YgdD (TMEM256/DUF423 family)
MIIRIAAALCFLAVALGAFGAHALRSMLEQHGLADAWNKAVLYQFVHALALLVIGATAIGNRPAVWLFLSGTVLFSGSLYALCLTNLRWLGAITPFGGLCFLAGWICIVAWPGR